MLTDTYLGNEIDSSDTSAQYDTHARRLLKDKGVLAYILVYAVEEFKDYSVEDAIAAIEGEPEVATRLIRPSATKPEIINGVMNESNLPGEGKMFFDIVFYAITRDNEHQKIYINLEAQNSFYPGYDLVTRGVIYSARLLSQQMDVEYTSRNYDGAKKVYSIWICMNAPKKNDTGEKYADTIVEYSMKPSTIYSKTDSDTAVGRFDLQSVIFICLCDDETTASSNKLIGMLSTLLSSKKNVETKKDELENIYNLPMTKEMETEACAMCNLSEGLYPELRKALKDEKDKNEAQQAELDSKQAEIENQQAKIDSQQAEIKSQQAKIDSQQAKIDNQQAEIDDLKKQIAIANAKISV